MRAVLRMPQVLHSRAADSKPVSIDGKVMAERGMKAGYMKDALKYLRVAHEAEPADFSVMLQMGWACNICTTMTKPCGGSTWHGAGSDPKIASEALKAWQDLRRSQARFQTTLCLFPVFSRRWDDLFSFGQYKDGMAVALSRSRIRERAFCGTHG